VGMELASRRTEWQVATLNPNFSGKEGRSESRFSPSGTTPQGLHSKFQLTDDKPCLKSIFRYIFRDCEEIIYGQLNGINTSDLE